MSGDGRKQCVVESCTKRQLKGFDEMCRQHYEETRCEAEYAGYDGWFGVYCELPKEHDGPHRDGCVEWRFL